MMRVRSQNLAKGIAMGIAVGAAMGIAGTKAMSMNKKQMRKTADRALRVVGNVVDNVGGMIGKFY